MPGIISSVILFIAGAIAKFAYSDSVWTWHSGGQAHSLQVDTIGVILMIAALGLFVVSAAWNFLWFAPTEETERDEIITQLPGAEPVRTVRRKRKNSR